MLFLPILFQGNFLKNKFLRKLILDVGSPGRVAQITKQD